MKRLLTILFSLCILAGYDTAQSDALKMVDSFERVPCSHIRGSLDAFLLELSQDTSVEGLVVIGGDFTSAVVRRALVENHFNERKFPKDRIRFVRNPRLPKYKVEFWKAPVSKVLPAEYELNWSNAVQNVARPFIVYAGGNNDSECLYPTGTNVLLDYINANPGSRGNVVIRCNGARCFQEQRRLVLEELPASNKEVKARIRFFYVPIRSEYFTTEFWLLP
ncbi:MAG TPA: hypothetical protein PLK77_07765 [Pyrinomonadaceae bacterium]|nr:hypothetical protein [Pyrinomonadaceae bacterium]